MTLDELIEDVSLLDYASQYIEMQYNNGEYWGLSPFKEENTPSFSIREEKNVFKDFASGVGGNIISFIMKYHKCDLEQAIDKLIIYSGCEGQFSKTPDIEIIKQLKKFSKRKKKTNLLKPRGQVNYKIISQFKVAPEDIWIDENISKETLEYFNILYDERNENILIPIHTNEGDLINFAMRTTKENYKSLGIPKYRYMYKLGTLDFLWGWHFNIDNIIEKKEIILVEGAKSVMKLHQWGFNNAVALLTSHLDEMQFKKILPLDVRIVVALDKDVEIHKDKFFNKLKKYHYVEVIKDTKNLIQDKESPCDKGIDVWQHLYVNKKQIR